MIDKRELYAIQIIEVFVRQLIREREKNNS